MYRLRSPSLLVALMGASVVLGACSSGGDDPVPTDDPVGVQGGATGVQDGAAAGATGVVDDEEGADDGAGQGIGDDSDTQGATDASDTDTDPGTPAGDEALSGTASRFGVLSVSRGGGIEDDDVFAGFFRLDEVLAVGDAFAELLPAPDTCTFDSAGGGGIDPDTGLVDVPDVDDPGLTPLSAGESIVVSGPAGTFATLPRTDGFGFVFYAPENDVLPGPIPSGLIADIPGDDFPAFAAVRIPDAPPLTGVSPAGLAGVTADTIFGWDAGDDPAVRVIVDVTLVGPDPVVSVSCSAADDGEFRLPASLLARIPDAQPAEAELLRVGVRVLQQDDAVLVVTSTGTR